MDWQAPKLFEVPNARPTEHCAMVGLEEDPNERNI